MMKKAVLFLFALVFTVATSFGQNCPAYSSNATGAGAACGNQNYILTVNNTGCNGQINFQVVGNYGSYGYEISWEIVSLQSGQIVATGVGFNNGNININVGPLDPNIHGNVFDLIVYDSWGDGFSGGGYIQTEQGGNVLANINGNFGGQAHMMFNANISISPATIAITTPSGVVTTTVSNCNDFIVQVPLTNTDFCNTLNVNLPWTITCDVTGATLSSGTHAVTVYPQVPASANDIVDITWNTNTCSWDISPQNDCDLLDIGNIFSISPDPVGLNTDACGNGNENFTVNYLGFSSPSPDCCATGGPQVNITYDDTLTGNTAVPITSPFGGINNSAYINIPPHNSGGNAQSLNLCVDVSNYCFQPPLLSFDYSFYLFIYVNGNQVYMSPQQNGNSFNICINLGNIPGGYNQSSVIEIYVLPNILYNAYGYTTFNPNANCGSLSYGDWNANIDVSLNVVFEQMIGSPQNCSFPLSAPHVCCDNIAAPTAQTPAPINIDCANNIPAPNPQLVTGINSPCQSTPTVTFVNDVSDNNTCQGEIITRTYRITDDCGNNTDITQLINVDAVNPTFSLSGNSPSTCNSTDGDIIISGLLPNTSYSVSYDFGGSTFGPTQITTDGSGNYTIIGLSDGNYTNFVIELTNCSACVGSDPVGVILNPLTAPTVNAGNDQTICVGNSITLTADNPNAAVITWDNGVSDGVAFAPSVGVHTYTATATANGCSSSDAVVITVLDSPIISINSVADMCEGAPPVSLTGQPSGGTFSGNGVVGNSFDPSLVGSGTHTVTYSYTDVNSCSNTATQTITVTPIPSFDITFSNPSGCGSSDGIITLTGLQANTTFIISYEQGGNTIGPLNSTSNANGNIIISNLGAGTFTDFVVDNGGCIGNNNNIITLTSADAPYIFAGNDITVCEGESVTLTALNPSGAIISWNNGVTDGVSFIPPVGTTNYIVTADKNGCLSYDNITVTVNKSPNVKAGQDIVTCIGDKITLSATGAVNYVWDNGVINNQEFIPPQGTTVYTVTGIDAYGCKNTDQISVTVNTPGAASFSTDIDKGCAPLTINFTNDINGLDDEKCEYVISNGVHLSGCNASYTFTSGGCYDITLYVTDNITGCVNKTTEQICVEPNPVASFNINPDYISEINNQIQFINTSKNADSYLWNFGDGSISIENKPRHIYDASLNEYHVVLIATSEYGCTDTASMIIPVHEELIYYIPNSFTPDWDNVNQVFKPIFTSGFDMRDYHFTVFNRWGEILFESFNHEVGWDGSYGINNTKAVKEGTYIWKIEFKTKLNDERVVISGHVNLIK